MEIIFDEFDDGIVSVNEYEQIDRVNTSVIKLLNIDRGNLVTRSIEEVIGGFDKLADLVEDSHSGGRSAGIYSHNKRKILINKIPVIGSKKNSHIYTFREIERIQKIEEHVRIKLAEKGYVTKYDYSDIWSKSEKFQALLDKARNFAKTEMNILITGESGTGKELFAHSIHRNSPRRDGPFVPVNFAGLSESLIESELFGYEDGAFTGAKRGGKIGLFEQAHGGTIFLDEIGDTPLNVQSRLLRVLQEKEVMRVSGSKIVPVNVRVIAATNKNLNEAIANNKFREDLYYRINTLAIKIPPLRDRKEDLIYIINKYLKSKYKIEKRMSQDVIDCILAYDWPGNIRDC
jgi:transcriptional regulator with PAS, ATPase and Fis domain